MFAIVTDGVVTGPFTAAEVCQRLNIGFDASEPDAHTALGIYPCPERPAVGPGLALESEALIVADGAVAWQMTMRPWTEDEWAEREAELHAQIDSEAGDAVARLITVRIGQDEEYREKEAEARAYLADPGGTYVFLSAEADLLGITMADLAADVIAKADEVRPLRALIGAHRRAAKVAVTAARTAHDFPAMTAAALIDWENLTHD